MFRILRITMTDAEMWHHFDQRIKKDERKSWAGVTFLILLTLLYLPIAIASVVALYLTNDGMWFYLAIINALCAFFNIALWQGEHYNIYLARYLKRPDCAREIKNIIASEYPIAKLMLYNESMVFNRAYLENGELCFEFNEHATPHTVRTYDYDCICTQDTDKAGLIVTDAEGITCYVLKEATLDD